ncbi:hypothetical protein FD755_018877 [Muntiacus reevesi]|uniref:Uncharacterized protein n=2 Tax=Muntiacus TaxID=9885 RepID=A0A5N3X8A5_MUNRE|nr:hypothetical protein FD754_014571 [Muntiacus muntjak]KAB0369884.1 hypothetical protein FD755_018877 [Muntiacus reevesi]
MTNFLTPRSLSPTPSSPGSPCSPLFAFHFWRVTFNMKVSCNNFYKVSPEYSRS